MSGTLLDDLGRVLATPMPRSRALRLLGVTVFCAIFPRSAAASSCAQQTCNQPIKCCLDFPGNANASTPAACCKSTEFCCKGMTPMGGSWAYVTCCQSYEFCYTDPSIVKCEPCPTPLCGSVCCQAGQTCVNGTCCPVGSACGNVCCQAGQTCVNGTCCPVGSACGNMCCPPGRLCASLRSPFGPPRLVCLCPPDRVCGSGCCPPGTTCSSLQSPTGTRYVCFRSRLRPRRRVVPH